MNLISLSKQFHIEVDCTRDHVDELSDAVADALYDLEQGQAYTALLDSTVSADLGARQIEINVTVQHPDVDTGVAVGQSAIKTAMKAAVEAVNGEGSSDESFTSTEATSELLAI